MTTQTEALKLALEALGRILESTPPYIRTGIPTLSDAAVNLVNKALECGKEALAQPEQEPVAFVDRKFGASCVGWHKSELPSDGTQLYTAPPKRQPLTDKQAHQALLDMSKHIETFGDESTTEEQLSGECIRFILEQVAAHDIKETT